MLLNSQDPPSERDNDKLTALLAAYREACPDPEPDANFMPMLWRKIEARQTFALTIRRTARAFVTVAVAICMLMTMVLVTARSRSYPWFESGTYVEMLAAEQAPEGLDMTDLAHIEGAGESDL